jgi:hypothetical protein
MGDESPVGRDTLLGLLSPRLQEELVSAADPLQLPAQSWLFREGDAGDRLYLVVSGRLRIVAERDGRERVLTTLGPGAALGELAVLTGAPRSASVQAVRDTELLELEGGRFAELLRRDPELGVGLAQALAERLQRGGMLEPVEAPVAIVTLATLPGKPVTRIWEELRAAFSELGDTVSYTEPSEDWTDLWTWGRNLAELERAHDHVLLHAELDDSDWAAFCIRQADRVLVVADGPPPNVALPSGADIAFVQHPSVDDVSEWSRRADARTHHIIPPADLREGTRRMARRLAGRCIGLVRSCAGD